MPGAADGGRFRFGPAAVSRMPNHVDLFATTHDRRLVHAFWNGQAWSGWLEDLPPGAFLSGPAAASRGAGRLDVLALGEDRRLYVSSWRDDLPGWSPWAAIPASNAVHLGAGGVRLELSEHLHVFARGDGSAGKMPPALERTGSRPIRRDPGPAPSASVPPPRRFWIARHHATQPKQASGRRRAMWRTHFDGAAWSRGGSRDMGVG